MFPKKHSFSYSYLFVGIPIGWRGSIASFLSVDDFPVSKTPDRKNTWFSVECSDYLDRGHDSSGLEQKLQSYLESQNEDTSDYHHAYLVTAPRFLGYSFNPVSFWYLYGEKKDLRAMILEVNNTFDERRMYFMKSNTHENGNAEPISSETEPPKASKFSNTWAKDFHVSPFNSRKGSYALSAQDPFFPYMNGKGTVDNTITLSSSKDHVKLIARIFSTSDSIDPTEMGTWDRLRFVSLWWWVGFVTFPRIVREAGKLFFRRKLHVWYRPEVLKDSVGRQATDDEKYKTPI
ncbi:MAG: hypothetical protein Q9190_007400 [Brigantiaea leucoxantha]